MWLAAVLSLLIYLHAAFTILPIPPRKDPLARSAGWRELGSAASAVMQRPELGGGHAWVAADRYQEAAELAFHLPGHPRTFSLNLGGRSNQYDFWPGFAETARVGDNLVVALDEGAGIHPIISRLAPYFRSFDADTLVDLRSRHGLVTRRRLWVMRDWTGGWPAR